jgi:hypothetical protein
MKNKRQHHPLFKRALSIVIACALLCMHSTSFGWGAGGHMMTAHIAFERLNPTARAKATELLAIPIDPSAVTSTSLNFVNASHWADDLRSLPAFDSLKPFHFVDRFFTWDKSKLPKIDPENILTALEDNVNILKTSTDKAEQARALRLIIHFVGDIHQPLHCTAKVSKANRKGDQGGNFFKIKIVGENGELEDSNLHSYWDNGMGAFPPTGPNFAPPPLETIAPAAELAMRGNPATVRALRLRDPFNYNAWSKESFALGRDVVYLGIRQNRVPTRAYNRRALRIAHQRVAWGGYRLAALLNAVWPPE